MCMGGCPNNILRTKGAVTAKKYLGICRLQGNFIQLRTIPLIKIDAQIPLNPRAVIVLSNSNQHMVTLDEFIRLSGRLIAQPPIVATNGGYALKKHTLQLAVFVHEFLGRTVVYNRNALAHGILFLPLGGLHHFKSRAHDDLHRFGTQSKRGTTAVHGGITAAHHDDLALDLADMTEGDATQPIDANVYIFVDLIPTSQFQIPTTRRASADKVGIKILGHKRFQTVDGLTEVAVHAHVQNALDLLVQHLLR